MSGFGPQGMPRNPQSVVDALKTLQPPQNPQTPWERLNPDNQVLEELKRASVCLTKATEFTNDQHIKMVLDAMIGTCNKAMLRFDGQAVMDSLREAVALFPAPVAPAGLGPAGMGAPPTVPPGNMPPSGGQPAASAMPGPPGLLSGKGAA